MSQYFAFQWHITEACDQRCKHCYIFAENACKKLDSMSWEGMQQVVDNVEEFCRTFRRPPISILPAVTRSSTLISGN